MSDDKPKVSPEAVAAREQADAYKNKAIKQLKDIIAIRKGTDEVRRVNGIAAALAQRFGP